MTRSAWLRRGAGSESVRRGWRNLQTGQRPVDVGVAGTPERAHGRGVPEGLVRLRDGVDDHVPKPRSPRHFDRFEGGRKRDSDIFLTEIVFGAFRAREPSFHAFSGVKTLSGTLLGPAFKRESGYGARSTTTRARAMRQSRGSERS